MVIFLFLSLLLLPNSELSAEPPREYEVKAAFLLNFARLTTWADTTFESPSAPVTFAIAGADPFGPLLENVISGQKLHERPLRIRRHALVAEAVRGAQILFISRSSTENISAEMLRSLPAVLTISDRPGFCARGGCIELYVEANKVRFIVNPAAYERAGLKVSSHLLRLARIYREDR
jgi:hypothetical protein